MVFDGDQGKKYASVIARIVETVQLGLEEISGGENEGVSSNLLGITSDTHNSPRMMWNSYEFEQNDTRSWFLQVRDVSL